MAADMPEGSGGRGKDALEAEDRPAGAVVRRLVREMILPHRRVLLLAVVCMAATAATNGMLPFLMQVIADEVFVAKDERLLYAMPLAVVGVMLLRGVVDWVARVAEAWLGNRIVADLRIRMFEALARADLAWLQRTHSGRFVSAFVNDAPIVDRAAAKTLTALVKNGLSVLVLVVAMLYMDWRLTLLVLAAMPFAASYLGRQRRRITKSVRRSMHESGALGSHVTQTLHGMRVVRAYAQEGREARRFRAIATSLMHQVMRTERWRATGSPVTEAAAGIGFALAIFYGGWQGIYGTVSVGHFMGFMTAAMLMYQPLRGLATLQATLTEGVAAANRVFAIIDHDARVAEAPDARPLAVTKGEVVFDRVSFGYEPGCPVLREFSLTIRGGETVALVGPSGSGKTTVFNLALRFFDPSSGAIRIDDQDIAKATLASLRGAIALLTQDPVLFDDTIGANIAYGSEGASPEAVRRAAQAAAADAFIARLADGYDTFVGEAGCRLSGGERQRVAFARAMLRNAPILLLDEPTSALDAEAEVKVKAAMETLLKGRTVIMIAHRLSTVKRADRICVMERGAIVEEGSHAELMARNGTYARMVRAQAFGDGTEDEGPRLALVQG